MADLVGCLFVSAMLWSEDWYCACFMYDTIAYGYAILGFLVAKLKKDIAYYKSKPLAKDMTDIRRPQSLASSTQASNYALKIGIFWGMFCKGDIANCSYCFNQYFRKC